MSLVRAALDRLFPPDPGWLRLIAAVSATLAGLTTFVIVALMGTIAAVPVIDCVLGFAIALFIAATVRDSTTPQKLKTIAIGGIGACASTIVAALLIDQPMADAVLLPAMMFVIAFFSVRGPRHGSIGLVSLIAYLIALVSKQPAETLPLRLLVIVVAATVAALVRCVLIPERPEAVIEHLRRAIRSGLNQVLARIAAAVDAGAWTAASRRSLRRQVSRLDEIIMLAQARLAWSAQQPDSHGLGWLQLFEIQLATRRVEQIALQDLGGPEERVALLSRIALIGTADQQAPPLAVPGRLGGALDILDHVLLEKAGEPDHPASIPPTASPPGWRPALQTAAASTLAIACSELILPNRWYWAAFAAFVMFRETRSRGESVAKGIAFVTGTSAGLLAGQLLATVLSGHELMSMVAIVVAVFLAFQANVIAYGVMVFWITVILGLMFGMMGYFTFDVLLTRLEESAIGVASGVLVACLVLTRRERDVTEEAAAAFLRSLRELVRGTAAVLLEGKPTRDLASHILGTGQRFRELKAVAASEQSSFGMVRRERLRRRVLVLGACENWGRELGTICLRSGRIEDAGLTKIAADALARTDATLGYLTGAGSKTAEAAAGADTANNVVPAGAGDPISHAVHLLLRLDAALDRVAAIRDERASVR
ncbi:FUSC family protein [Mesorhizobium sp. M1066]|uniref:FUSC family protein n=1 Tax=unclassified Mesorhizobium TaxID=325217 RepID=UPI00333747F2